MADLEEMRQMLSAYMKREMNRAEAEDKKTDNQGEKLEERRSFADTAASVRTFGGGSSIEAEGWLEDLEFAREDGRWSWVTTKSVLCAKLVGAAKIWHRGYGRGLDSFEKWVECFKVEFVPEEGKGEITQMLLDSRQNKGESVQEYAFRVEALARKVGWQFPETKKQVIKGLLPEYGCAVNTVYVVEHKTVGELARSIQSIKDLNTSWKQNGGQTGSRGDGKPNGGRGCFECGKEGHRRAECPNRKAGNGGRPSGGADQQGDFRKNFSFPSTPFPNNAKSPQPENRPDAAEASRPKEPAKSNSVTSENAGKRPPIICHKCNQPGHIQRFCRTVQQLEESRGDEEFISFDARDEQETKMVVVNGKEWPAKIDTGAQISVISESAARKLDLTLSPSDVSHVRGVGQGNCETIGQADVQLETDGLELENVTLTVLPREAMLGEEILLGRNVLERNDVVAVVSADESWFVRKQHLADMPNGASSQRPKVNLKLTTAVKLKPRSVALVTAEPVNHGDGAVLISDRENWEALYEIKDREIVIPVANMSQKELPLAAGTVVARATFVQDENFFKLRKRGASVQQAEVATTGSSRGIPEADLVVDEGTPERFKQSLAKLLNDYADVVATTMVELGRTSLTSFDIEEVAGSQPVRCRPIQLSLAEREGLQDIIQQLFDADMIEKSNSQYASPVLLVKKSGGSWRLVVGYRRLNAQTLKMNYPLPLIDDILDGCSGKGIYSC